MPTSKTRLHCVTRWAALATLAVAGCASVPAPVSSSVANTEGAGLAQEQKFEQWVANFYTTAQASGIDASTLQSAFSSVQFLARVIELDRSQPEFNRPVWAYLDSAVSAQRIANGQEKLRQLRADIDPIATRYGVPTEILFAFWGIESNFGSNLGDFSTIDALATLAYEGRREDWARTELLAALRILQNHDIERTRMVGSWAGAMGQTQFMPTVFLAHAVDADGDGRRDIWNSLPDVMASTANFVAKSGWRAGEPWGVEVRLPSGFAIESATLEERQPSSAWAGKGVQTMDGAPLPILHDSSVLLPAGASGPAFLVGTNFRTILKYNNSTSYALAVGLLAQQMAGGAPVQTPWPRDLHPLSRSQVQTLQELLNAQGFDSGTPDGVMGPATQRAIRQFQQSRALPADGYPTLELLTAAMRPHQTLSQPPQ